MSENEIFVSPIVKPKIDPRTLNVPDSPPKLQSQVVPLKELSKTNNSAEAGITQNIVVSNVQFIADVFKYIPKGASAAICSKPKNPENGGWIAYPANNADTILVPENNNYVNCSSFYPGEDGSFNARLDRFAACHFLLLDDLGTKIPFERLNGFELSWLIETSPGNYQGGIILDNPITDKLEAERLIKALISAGLCDPGSRGINRWARLPVAINGKPKYVNKTI